MARQPSINANALIYSNFLIPACSFCSDAALWNVPLETRTVNTRGELRLFHTGLGYSYINPRYKPQTCPS